MSEQPHDKASDREALHLDDEARWLDWPRCPQCGRHRQTYCPTCDIAGDQFPLAEYIPAAAPVQPTRRQAGCACQSCHNGRGHGSDESQTPVLLMCPSCDEAFAPMFYRRCQECGRDFGDGREVESPDSEEFSWRVLVVIVVLALLTIAVLVYFWQLFPS